LICVEMKKGENRYLMLQVRRLVGVLGSGSKITELDIVTGHDVISPRMISTQNGVIGNLFLFNNLDLQWLVV
jgi:hypothetical protein